MTISLENKKKIALSNCIALDTTFKKRLQFNFETLFLFRIYRGVRSKFLCQQLSDGIYAYSQTEKGS